MKVCVQAQIVLDRLDELEKNIDTFTRFREVRTSERLNAFAGRLRLLSTAFRAQGVRLTYTCDELTSRDVERLMDETERILNELSDLLRELGLQVSQASQSEQKSIISRAVNLMHSSLVKFRSAMHEYRWFILVFAVSSLMSYVIVKNVYDSQVMSRIARELRFSPTAIPTFGSVVRALSPLVCMGMHSIELMACAGALFGAILIFPSYLRSSTEEEQIKALLQLSKGVLSHKDVMQLHQDLRLTGEDVRAHFRNTNKFGAELDTFVSPGMVLVTLSMLIVRLFKTGASLAWATLTSALFKPWVLILAGSAWYVKKFLTGVVCAASSLVSDVIDDVRGFAKFSTRLIRSFPVSLTGVGVILFLAAPVLSSYGLSMLSTHGFLSRAGAGLAVTNLNEQGFQEVTRALANFTTNFGDGSFNAYAAALTQSERLLAGVQRGMTNPLFDQTLLNPVLTGGWWSETQFLTTSFVKAACDFLGHSQGVMNALVNPALAAQFAVSIFQSVAYCMLSLGVKIETCKIAVLFLADAAFRDEGTARIRYLLNLGFTASDKYGFRAVGETLRKLIGFTTKALDWQVSIPFAGGATTSSLVVACSAIGGLTYTLMAAWLASNNAPPEIGSEELFDLLRKRRDQALTPRALQTLVDALKADADTILAAFRAETREAVKQRMAARRLQQNDRLSVSQLEKWAKSHLQKLYDVKINQSWRPALPIENAFLNFAESSALDVTPGEFSKPLATLPVFIDEVEAFLYQALLEPNGTLSLEMGQFTARVLKTLLAEEKPANLKKVRFRLSATAQEMAAHIPSEEADALALTDTMILNAEENELSAAEHTLEEDEQLVQRFLNQQS